jgi:hypothetical protein
MRAEHPDQVEHIYIHDVTNAGSSAARFVNMTVFKDWSEIAKYVSGQITTTPKPADTK